MRMSPRRSCAAVTVVAAVVCVAAGCGGDSGGVDVTDAPANSSAAPSSVSRPPLPNAADADRSSGTSVMLAMCQIVFTRDTIAEESYSSSYQRAANLMTPQLRAELLQPSKGVRPFPQWVQWQQSKAWIRGVCTVSADEHPADTNSTQSRVLAVTEQPYDAAGDALDQSEAAVWVSAIKQGGAWSVSRFDVTLDDSQG